MDQVKECGCKSAPAQKSLNLSSTGVNLMDSMSEAEAGCAQENANPLADYDTPGFKLSSYVEKFIETEVGQSPIIKSKLGQDDLLATFLVRCGVNRHQYTVAPGLYGLGEPDKTSEVLVTANFKLTFDHLRKELHGLNVWLLVLDTKGVNVWCAAGKGTFSTGELVKKIKASSLARIVEHRRIIVPQLGATGVSARQIKKQSGFKVVYGPIRAADIPDFLKNGKKASREMRGVTFNMYERLILTPVEIQSVLKPALITALVLFVISGLGPGIFSVAGAWQRGLASFLALAVGIFSGAFVTPVLLPFIPYRTFAAKGIIIGSLLAIFLLLLLPANTTGLAGYLALYLFSVSISSFLAMNFTGSTPFTSPSGVEKEMKQYIPVQLSSLVISSGLWIYSAF